MCEANSLREAILQQAAKEAARIVTDAEGKATQILGHTQRQRGEQLETIRLNAIQETDKRRERTQAEGRAQSRKAILQQKTKLLVELKEHARKKLETSQSSDMTQQSIKNLLVEGLVMFPKNPQLRIAVRKQDMSIAKEILEELGLSRSAIIEAANGILGGIILESSDGLLRVDNSYDTRLGNYVKTFLPEICKILFES